MHRWRRGILPVVVILAALVISGCSGNANALTGPSWPGITAGDDTIYVAFQAGVHAIDGETRDTVWSYSAVSERRTLIGGRSPVNFYAEPAVGEGIVVAGDYTETLHALDADNGQLLWTFSTNRARFIGGAVVDDGVVYAGAADGNLYALDAGSGEELWAFPTDGEIWDAPLLAGGVLYVPSLDHRLYAINAQNGREVWRFETGGAVVSTPTLDDSKLYFGAFDRMIYALDVESGRVLWQREVKDWVWDSPAVANGLLIAGDLSGNVYGLNSDDGSIDWEIETLDDQPVVGTPLIQDDTAYFASGDANVYAVNVENGQEQWSETITSEFSGQILFIQTGTSVRDVPIYGPLVPYEDQLLVGLPQSDELLRVLNAAGGAKAGTYVPEEGAQSTPSAGEEEEPEELTPAQQVLRWGPLVVSMILFTILLSRRQQSQ
jgi:outer membrane protein assembly factor BamB